MPRYFVYVAIVASCLLLGPSSTFAHPLAPALLELRDVGEDRYDVIWRLPLARARGIPMRVQLPAGCRELIAPSVQATDRGVETTWRVDCAPTGLTNQTLTVRGLVSPLSAVVRIIFMDNRIVDGLVTARSPEFVVPEAPSLRSMLSSYAGLGIAHIGTGLDHLLFVFGLTLLSSTRKRLIATVTAFTVGHSVTLGLASFGLIRVPSGPIEVAIALSVLLVAIEVARNLDGDRHEQRRPWLIAGSFGLLHGLGFASALSESGLEGTALLWGLAAFNVGIEVGQLAFVLCVIAAGVVLRRFAPSLPGWSLRVPVYVMGTLAAYWCFYRAALWWGW